MIILIDDLRNFWDQWKGDDGDMMTIRTLDEAMSLLDVMSEKSTIDELWLDHDLGEVGGVKTDIRPFVNALEERAFLGTAPKIKQVFIHTDNRVGRDWIFAALQGKFNTRRVASYDFFTHPDDHGKN